MLRVVEQAVRSDTGRQRTANEDSLFARPPLFAVADGMGGARAGEVASRIAVEAFEPAERSDESPEAFLREIAERANRRIHDHAERDSSHSGMGTTLTAALVDGGEVSIAHVGDSRAYVLRDGKLRLLTSDHSLVEELRRQGRLTDEQAEDHPQRSIITRALGPESEVEVDTLTFSARPEDVFLLCSDGLTTMIKDERIAGILLQAPDLESAVESLVAVANEAGGRDNITVVAFRLAEAEEGVEVEGKTLVGPSAEEAGLTAGAVRERVARERAAEAGAARGSATRRGVAEPSRRRSRWKTAAKALAVIVLLAGLGIAAWWGARQVYFLGTDEGGRLTLYRGLPYELPFDANLYSEVYSVPLQVRSLPEDRRDSAINHELRSREDAVSLLNDLEAAAAPSTGAAGAAGGGGNQGAGAGQGGSSGDGDGDGAAGRDAGAGAGQGG